MQTSYSQNFDIGVEGAIADGHFVDAVSGSVEAGEAVKAGMAFGRVVKRGSKEGLIAAMTVGAKALGVLKHKHSEDGLISDYEEQAVVRKGRMLVKVTEDVVAGDAVAFDSASGEFAKTVAGDVVTLAGAEYMSSALTGELAIVSLNMPA